MPSYFGQQNTGGADNTNQAGIFVWSPGTFTCPGSGDQNIQELSSYVNLNTATPSCAIRLGVYSASNTKVAEGTSAVAITSGAAWQGHMSQAAVKAAGGVSPGVLTGGVEYKIAVAYGAYSSGAMTVSYDSGASANMPYKVQDSTGGDLPALPTPDGSDSPFYSMRCGVDSAGPPPPAPGGHGFGESVGFFGWY